MGLSRSPPVRSATRALRASWAAASSSPSPEAGSHVLPGMLRWIGNHRPPEAGRRASGRSLRRREAPAYAPGSAWRLRRHRRRWPLRGSAACSRAAPPASSRRAPHADGRVGGRCGGQEHGGRGHDGKAEHGSHQLLAERTGKLFPVATLVVRCGDLHRAGAVGQVAKLMTGFAEIEMSPSIVKTLFSP